MLIGIFFLLIALHSLLLVWCVRKYTSADPQASAKAGLGLAVFMFLPCLFLYLILSAQKLPFAQ
jgi:hypothetical protein